MIPRSNIEARLPKPLAVDSKEDLNPRLCTVLFLKYIHCLVYINMIITGVYFPLVE